MKMEYIFKILLFHLGIYNVPNILLQWKKNDWWKNNFFLDIWEEILGTFFHLILCIELLKSDSLLNYNKTVPGLVIFSHFNGMKFTSLLFLEKIDKYNHDLMWWYSVAILEAIVFYVSYSQAIKLQTEVFNRKSMRFLAFLEKKVYVL